MLNKVLKRVGAAALAAAFLFMAGCSNNKNKNNREFLNVNGVSFTEGEMYHNIYYSVGSSFSGIIDYNEIADINEIKEAVDNLEKDEKYSDFVKQQKIAFVKQKVSDEKLLAIAKENNITLTEDEQAEVDQEYNSIVDFFNSEETLTQIKEQFYQSANNPEQSSKSYLEKYKKFYLNLYAVSSMEQLKDKFNALAIENKVLEQKANQVPDDEEHIKAYYEQKKETQKADYERDISNFDYDYDYGEIICHYPAGLRYVKHILVKFTDEDQENLLQYETKISELEAKENRTDEENAELEDTKNKASQLSSDMDKKAKTRADEAYAKITGGADFDAVLKEYGEDASMSDESSQYAQKGYLINESSNMVKEFLTVAMALKNPGDVSKPVKSTYGYHIIKYVEKGKEGDVPYEEVRDQLLTIAMDEKRQQEITKYYDSLYDEMLASGQVNINYDVLGFDKETYDRLYQELKNAATTES